MAYDYYELLSQARQWAQQALAAGRLNKEKLHELLSVDERHADDLFAASGKATSDRPLIAAFMGGTGVGKSSLLNRLAGQPIARAGLARPTSREVTLYHHQALSIQHLPAGLPLDSVKISRHEDVQNRNIVWMDMPDFDSIEQGNQRQVLEWLPHIDVLIYVVSPERYRDNKAWQMLLAEGLKHAWLFVMNQWDRGLAVQFEDFIQQLHKAGFENPLAFRTSCLETQGDDFAELLRQLQSLSQQHSLEQLQLRNRQLRAQKLKQILLSLAEDLRHGDFKALSQFYDTLWRNNETKLIKGLEWPLQQLAKQWAEQPGQKTEIKLWDDWAQSRLDDVLDEMVLQAEQLGVPCKPLKTGLQLIKQHAEKKVLQHTESACRNALLNPGNGLQRFLLKLTAICETLLPLLAMAAVGYQVFTGYYHGAIQTDAYLGVDFAVHSVLLIGLSWLIPFFLHKKLQPSLQKTALHGLRKGLQQALLALDVEIKDLLAAEQGRHVVVREQLAEFIGKCEPVSVGKVEKGSLLGRVLLVE